MFVKKLLCALALAALLLSPQAGAQETYPSRAITVIVPLTAGSQLDILARGLADGMSKLTSQPVVVLNREGAAGTIGVGAVARSKPDGYTIGFGPDGSFVVQPYLRTDLPYKVDEFEFLCRTNVTPLVFMVGPNSPYHSLADLIAAARANPGKLNYGTIGHASSFHLLAESVALESGIKWNHVPYRALNEMTTQALNGTLDFVVSLPNTLLAGNGTMRGLAITDGGDVPNMPKLPRISDLGIKYSAPPSVTGLYAPKGTPPEALAWLRKACAQAVQAPGFITASTTSLSAVNYADGATYAGEVQRGNHDVGDLIRKLNITAQ